jgi:hypothetical protein
VPKVAREKIFLACGIHCRPNFFLFCPTNFAVLLRILPEGIEIVYDYHCYQMTLRVNNYFIQTGSGAKCWQEISQRAAGRAAAGRVRDFGQNVLQSCNKTPTQVSKRGPDE